METSEQAQASPRVDRLVTLEDRVAAVEARVAALEQGYGRVPPVPKPGPPESKTRRARGK